MSGLVPFWPNSIFSVLSKSSRSVSLINYRGKSRIRPADRSGRAEAGGPPLEPESPVGWARFTTIIDGCWVVPTHPATLRDYGTKSIARFRAESATLILRFGGLFPDAYNSHGRSPKAPCYTQMNTISTAV